MVLSRQTPTYTHSRSGRKPLVLRDVMYGIFSVNKTGGRGRMMPTDLGTGHTLSKSGHTT